MYKILTVAILFILNSFHNHSYHNQLDEELVKKVLEKIAIENIRSWEPPFYEEKMLEPFTMKDDFLVIIDEFIIKDYNQWKEVVYDSMQEERESNFKKYTHIIRDIHTSVLSENSGVVTVVYTWDYITKENKHYNTNATATLVFRLEKNGWKIVRFHCSHSEDKLLTDNTEE